MKDSMEAYRVWLLIILCSTSHSISSAIPQEIRKQLPETLQFQTYTQPYDEQKPQPEELVSLTIDDVEKLGSQNILANLEEKIKTGLSLATPIELYLVDRNSLLTLTQLAQDPSLVIHQDPQTIANLLLVADALILDRNKLLAALTHLSDHTLCAIYQMFEQHNFPLISSMLEKTFQERLQYKFSDIIDNQSPVLSITISSNSTDIISGSLDKIIRIWTFNDTNWQLQQLLGKRFNKDINLGHIGQINSVALSRDNKRLISGSRDTTIRVWNYLDGKWQLGKVLGEANNTDTAIGHTLWINSVALSANGRRILSVAQQIIQSGFGILLITIGS